MEMTSRGNGIGGCGRGVRLLPLLALAAFLLALIPGSVSAQFFSDRPPPIPPASVPEVPSGPALNLAPPSGAGSGPVLPGPLNQPTIVQPSIATSTLR